MISYIVEVLPRPLAVIVGEPTAMKPVAAHKGAFDWRTVIKGKAAHSSLPHLGAHTIFAGARLISFIEQMQADFRRQPATGTSYTIPYPTLSVGIAHGGTAGNIIPDQFTFEWEARTLDAGQADEIVGTFNAFAEATVLPQLRQTASDASITTTPLFNVPPLTRIAGGDAETFALKLSGQPLAPAVSFCTEAGLFQQAGLSTILCGPGSIDQAHQPDEYVSIDQLELCRAFLLRVLDSLTS
jgi:acetylornithine deacetylase